MTAKDRKPPPEDDEVAVWEEQLTHAAVPDAYTWRHDEQEDKT